MIRRRLGAVLIALGVICVLAAFCLDASAVQPTQGTVLCVNAPGCGPEVFRHSGNGRFL